MASSELPALEARWVQYVGSLVETQRLSPAELLEIVETPSDPTTGILKLFETRSKSDLADRIHFQVLNSLYQSSALLKTADLHSKYVSILDAETAKKVTMQKTIHDSRFRISDDFIEWVHFPPGRFFVATKTGEKIEITIPRGFRLSKNMIQKQQWVELMGDTLNVVDPIEHNNIALGMTWNSAAHFANRLSEILGYQPVYDFSHAEIIYSTRAEDGTAKYKNDVLIQTLEPLPNTKTGFRLASIDELFYISSALGKFVIGAEKANLFYDLFEKITKKLPWIRTTWIGREIFSITLERFNDYQSSYYLNDQAVDELFQPYDLWTHLENTPKGTSATNIWPRESAFGVTPKFTPYSKIIFKQGSIRSYPHHSAPQKRDGIKSPWCLCPECTYEDVRLKWQDLNVSSRIGGFRLVIED